MPGHRAGERTRQSNMEQQHRIPHVVYRRVSRFRQHLAFPVHGFRKRRWGVPHPVRDTALPSGETVLLFGDDYRTIFRQFVRQSLESIAGFRW